MVALPSSAAALATGSANAAVSAASSRSAVNPARPSPRDSLALPMTAVAVTRPSASNATLTRFPFGSVTVAGASTR